MKLTYEQKVQIYHDWKSNRMSAAELAEHYHIALSNIKYLVELADKHGVSALEHKYTSYTSEFKLNAIYRCRFRLNGMAFSLASAHLSRIDGMLFLQ